MHEKYLSMNHFKIIAISTFLLVPAILAAQTDLSYYTQGASGNISLSSIDAELIQVIDGVSTVHYAMSRADFNGSPYLTEEFVEGTMTTLDGTVVPGLSYRYDIFGDKMQFLINRDTATINKPLALRSVEIGERTFVYEVYMLDANRVATGYFEVAGKNEHVTILYRREIEIEQDIYVANYGGGGGTKEFIMKEDNSYYLKYGTSAAQKINSKKSLLKILSDHQDQVKRYMKKHRLSVKKKEDLLAIADYYSNLLEPGS